MIVNSTSSAVSPLGWFGIVRLGLVQTSLGAIVVLATSTLNRVMVVELALPAMLPGALVAIHYVIQLLRPRWGYSSDQGGRSTPWIIAGMATLCLGGVTAALATALMATNLPAGIALAIVGFVMIGIGVGAAGTSLLVLLAKRVVAERRAAAATIVWVMMIAGFIVTAGTAGHFLDPFSPERLVAVTAAVAAIAFSLSLVAVAGVEGNHGTRTEATASAHPKRATVPFRTALAEVWQETEARRFTIFVFVSMLAYSAQDLILEPYAGAVFGYTPGQSTQLAGVQNGGVLSGMIMVAVVASLLPGGVLGSLRFWTVSGCLASAVALFGIAVAGIVGPAAPLKLAVFLLGLANGAFAVAAIGSMMALAGKGRSSREGVRMGIWGAAQAIAFGAGGLIGAIAADVMKLFLGSPAAAYIAVFSIEALLFVVAATLALTIGNVQAGSRRQQPVEAFGTNVLAGVAD